MQAALHAATATLPHLRRGLTAESASRAAPHLLELTQAAAIALADSERVLAFVGEGDRRHAAGDAVETLRAGGGADRVHVEPRLDCGARRLPAARGGRRAGDRPERRRRQPVRVLHQPGPDPARRTCAWCSEAASLVGAQVALAALETQGELLARAELRALRAQISPHFVYNALTAVANSIHTSPEEARELLTEFAEFIRYAFARERPYVTLADELRYVEKYLRLEQARFGDRLQVRVQVAPEVLHTPRPRALRAAAGRERDSPRPRDGYRAGRVRDRRLRLRPRGGAAGRRRRRRDAARAGRGGARGRARTASASPTSTGRLQTTFGEQYGLEIESQPGGGTTVVMTLPKGRAGVRVA